MSTPEFGRIRPPYPRPDCANEECGKLLTEETGAYLHQNLKTGKLTTLCGSCSQEAELVAHHWLPLILL